ncbi:MAG: hypothetical protein AAGI07_18695, partial [Bacteroidota bacterium]
EQHRETILNGSATQKLIDFKLSRNGKSVNFRVGLVTPNSSEKVPVIIKNDTFLFSLEEILNAKKREKYKRQKRDETNQFSIEKAVENEYALLKFMRNDVVADHKDNKDTGIYPLFPEYDWGNTAAWAWAYSIIIDWLEEQSFCDTNKLIVTGHSRGGKTALCAGIYDERIALTIPNSSGTGGTGSWLFFVQNAEQQTLNVQINRNPYWWCSQLLQFKDKPETLPFDAHFNKMLIAPRALLNTHSKDDLWANPYGTYLTHLAAKPIFEAYDVPENIALHWREGEHDQAREDWDALFDYSQKLFFEKPIQRTYNQNPNTNYTYDSLLSPYFKETAYFEK